MNLHANDRPLIMGILNLTPDSFSDGGEYFDPDRAIQHAQRMCDEGADLIDIGGESTRPGSKRVSADEQIQRVIPVLERLRKDLADNILFSIDTTLADVAKAALAAGASIINDVTAGRNDEGIFMLAAEKRVSIILMHMQGTPETMQDNPHYEDAVEEIREFLLERAAVAQELGIAKDKIILDPGIGFGKSQQHNLDLMANLHRFIDTGYTVLLGASRKRFLASICKIEQHGELIGATCATTAIGVAAGVKIIRVHDVKENRQAADVAWDITNQ